MSSFREQTEENLKTVLAEIERAQYNAGLANAYLADLQREARAMQAALDVMDGKELQAPVPLNPSIMFPLQGADAKVMTTGQWAPTTAPAPPTAPVMLNGFPIILESGMRVGKNAFGEDVIVPENSIDPPLMAEPTKPGPTSSILPPINANDTFGTDPQELFS